MEFKNVYVLVAVALCISACATGSVRMLDGSKIYTKGDCSVEVFHTKQSAIEAGLNKEVCVVEGSSAFSFDHSIEGAVKKNVKKVCECGVNKAYISSAHREAEMGFEGVSYVNLVGFK